MPAILTVSNSDGTKRCDATCHNARRSKCVCCCGGRYHGTGARAREMLTRDMLGDDWKNKLGVDPDADVTEALEL